MAFEAVAVAVKLGRVGLKRLSKNEECMIVMEYGLSFFLDEDKLEGAFNLLDSNAEIVAAIAKVSAKVDLLLDEASTSSTQLLRDAYTAFDAQNYEESIQLFKEVGENARKAFNLSDNIDAWVASTQLRITDIFMRKSFEGGRFHAFPNLSALRQKEIATNLKDRVDDMLTKVDKEKKLKVEKAKNKVIGKEKKLTKTRETLRATDSKVNLVLRRVYPVITQGLGWTNPDTRVSPNAQDHQIDVFPKYIPEGKDSEVSIVISRRPEIVVSLYRRLDFAYESLQLEGEAPHVLNWDLNGTSHQTIFDPANVSEPVSLKIERPELEFIFRGGQSQSPWVIPNQSPRPSMRRSVSVVQNSPLAGSESPQPSKQLSKVVGMAMKADSLSKTTGKKAEPAVQARLLSRQEEANKGEKGKDQDVCAKCEKPIYFSQVHVSPGVIYHSYCFRCVDCEARLGGAAARNPGQSVEYSITEHGPVCGVGFGCKKGEGEKGTTNGIKAGTVELKQESSPSRKSKKEKKKKMQCDECNEDLVGTYFEKDGKNVCEKDYEKYRKKCSVCGEYIQGSFYTKDDKFICAKDYKEQQGGNTSCHKCGKEALGSGEILRALGVVFHPACFVCAVCNKDLTAKDTPFQADDAKNLFCRDCYNKKFAPRCCACNLPIAPKEGEESASRVRVFDKDWHPECFKCADCGSRLGGDDGKKCYPKDDTPLCLDCNKARK